MTRRPYKRQLASTSWWLKHPRYIRYMLREFSALFIGIYILVLTVGLYRLSEGAEAYSSFLSAVGGLAGLGLAILTFIFAIYHSYTWFAVTPKAMPLRFAGKPVPAAVIVAAHWCGFIIISLILWLIAGSG